MYICVLPSGLDALVCHLHKDVANIELNDLDEFRNFRIRLLGMIVGQVLLGIAGFGVSLYAFYVKKQRKNNPKYRALCDLGPNASCSRVLTSEYGIGLGLTKSLFGENSIMNASNVNLGIGLYVLQIIFGLINISTFNNLALFLSLISCIVSIYLACILAFVLKDLCLVCVISYAINAGLLWSNIQTVYS